MYDVVFVSYREPNAEENFRILRARVPGARRVHGVRGILNAYRQAAAIATTDMVWLVDGDAQLVPGFTFGFEAAPRGRDVTYIWDSINPVNGLVYGYGGVKLMPRHRLLEAAVGPIDVTTRVAEYVNVGAVSNVTAFNTDPFNSWRSAFRECAKLASGAVRKDDPATAERLHTWSSHGADRPFGRWCLQGAHDGIAWARHADGALLSKINDMDWLERRFRALYGPAVSSDGSCAGTAPASRTSVTPLACGMSKT
jgi:hypothetical protein